MQQTKTRRYDENMQSLMSSIEQIRRLIAGYQEEEAEADHTAEIPQSAVPSRIIPSSQAEDLISRAEETAGELLDHAEEMLAESSERSRKMIEEAAKKVQEAEAKAEQIRQNAEEAASRIREEAGRSARETQRRMTAENSQLMLDARKEAEDVHAVAVKEAEEILFHAQQEADRIRQEALAAIPESEEEKAKARAKELLEEARNEAQQVLKDAGDEAQRLISEANEENRRMVMEAHNMLANTKEQADGLLADAHSSAERIVVEAEEVSATRKLEIVQMEQDAETTAMEEDSHKASALQNLPEKAQDGHLLLADLGLLLFLITVFTAAFVLSTESGLSRQSDLWLCAIAAVPVLFMAYRFYLASWILAAAGTIGAAVWKLVPVASGRSGFRAELLVFILLPLLLSVFMRMITLGIEKAEKMHRSVAQTRTLFRRIDPVTALYGKSVLVQDLHRMMEQQKNPSLIAVFLECHDMDDRTREELLRRSGVLLENLVSEDARIYSCSENNCFVVLTGCDEEHAAAMEEGILERLNSHPALTDVHASISCRREEVQDDTLRAEPFVEHLLNAEA